MIATSFSEAWAEGARKYQKWQKQEKLRVVAVREAWGKYFPVTLAPARYTVKPPVGNEVKTLIERERAVLVAKSLEGYVAPYNAVLRNNPRDVDALIQIGIIYAKNGLYEFATNEFQRALTVDPRSSAAYNNGGNIHYLRGDYENALRAYRQAEQLDPGDAGIKINLALTQYRLGKLKEAVAKHTEAVALDDKVAQRYTALQKLLVH